MPSLGVVSESRALGPPTPQEHAEIANQMLWHKQAIGRDFDNSPGDVGFCPHRREAAMWAASLHALMLSPPAACPVMGTHPNV